MKFDPTRFREHLERMRRVRQQQRVDLPDADPERVSGHAAVARGAAIAILDCELTLLTELIQAVEGSTEVEPETAS